MKTARGMAAEVAAPTPPAGPLDAATTNPDCQAETPNVIYASYFAK